MLAYEDHHYIKVAHILPGYGTNLNLDEEMIARAPIFCTKSNIKLTQECLDKVYFSYQCDTFKIDNVLVYQILIVFMDMDAHVYEKQRKSTQGN